jgi:hypothetical protein
MAKKSVERGVAWVLGAAALAFVLLLAGFGSDLLTDDPPAPEDNPYSSGPSTSTPADGPTATTGGETTGPAAFVVSAVGFEHGGWVEVRNVGETAGTLRDMWLCQRPSYFNLPDITLGPGASVIVAADSAGPELDEINGSRNGAAVVEAGGSVGRITADSGEMGLYTSSSFGSSDDIASYVEWGSGGHGRSSTAIAAGVWVDGGFVATADATFIEATVETPDGPEDWVVAIP